MDSSRRESLTRQALNPETKQVDMEVLIHADRLRLVSGRNKAETYTAAYTLPETLRNPDAIFEGLRRDEDEPRCDNSVGWLCYVHHPARRYDNEGKTYPTSQDWVFLAFVDDERVVYRWTWENTDETALERGEHLPVDYETRFDRRVY
jgi:hypothetical protein